MPLSRRLVMKYCAWKQIPCLVAATSTALWHCPLHAAESDFFKQLRMTSFNKDWFSDSPAHLEPPQEGKLAGVWASPQWLWSVSWESAGLKQQLMPWFQLFQCKNEDTQWAFISLFNSAPCLHLYENFTLVAPAAWSGPKMPQPSPHHLSHLHIYVQRHQGLVKKTQKSNFASTGFMVGNTDKLFLSLLHLFIFIHEWCIVIVALF